MKSLRAWALALSMLAAAGAASAAEDHHGGGAHAARPSGHAASVHRSAPVRVTRTRTVTPTHRTTVTRRTHPTATRHRTHHTTTVRRVTTTHRKVTAARHIVTGARKVDISRYRRVVRAPHRYRINAWVAPRGFSYRRFSLGERIPGVLLAADFFLTSFALYGLEAPPDGYVWVRDGTDAVLVDRETGEVVQVQYDAFY